MSHSTGRAGDQNLEAQLIVDLLGSVTWDCAQMEGILKVHLGSWLKAIIVFATIIKHHEPSSSI